MATALALVLGAAPVRGDNLPTAKVSRDDVVKLGPEMRGTFAGLQYILSAYQIRQFIALPDDAARDEWINHFWQLNDPTPTTPANEMRVEHTVRVKLAREYFRSEKWPGWDKRGEVFIRYGPPNYRGRIWGQVTVNRGLQPPRELWYYGNHNMLVSFQNFGLKGEYIYAIDPLGSAAEVSPDLAEFLAYETDNSLMNKIPLDLLQTWVPIEYIDLDSNLQQFDFVREQEFMMDTPTALPDEIDQVINSGIQPALPRDVSGMFAKEQARKMANNFEATLEDTPASYPFNFNNKQLPFYFAIDQFRAGENTNRVDVQLEVPITVETAANASFEENIHAEVVVWDTNFNEIERSSRDITLRSGPNTDWSHLVPTQVIMALDEGYYRLAISMRGENSGHESSFRTSFQVTSFDPGLSVSDLLFARSIIPTETPSIFTRGPLDVVPHPLRAYSRTAKLPIYFEIYNLITDDDGVSSYTVEYKIIPHSNAKRGFWSQFNEASPVVSSKFQTSAFGDSDRRNIQIDTSNLRKGSYDLLITVTDDETRGRSFTRGTFSLVD